MDLDLGEVLKGGAAFADVAANDPSEFDRLVAVMTQMQEGINTLTDIMIRQKAEIETLKVRVARIEAMTSPATRPKIIIPRNVS